MKKVELGLGGGSLLQLANRSISQMMGYLIENSEGKLIVIDGGNYCREDAENLYEQIKARGGAVDMWFLSHAHADHLGAFVYMMERWEEYPMQIGKVCFHFPSMEWLSDKEDFEVNKQFMNCLKKLSLPVATVYAGDVFNCGDVSVEVVSHPVSYENYPQINPTSVILLVHFPKQDVLFLGDFDVNGQEEFLRLRDVSKIRKDIVQMAHHGQNGVDQEFYKLISPKICLYPTPQWLWENNNYGSDDPTTVGKEPFSTLETRKWMEELGVKASYTQAEGDWLFV